MSTEFYERQKNKSETKTPDYTMRRLAAAALLSVMMVGGIKGVNFVAEGGIDNMIDKAKNPYEYSEETMTWRANPGDGLNDAVTQIEGIGGFEQFDIRKLAHDVKNMPENKETLEDGLQVGEILHIPRTVSKK